MQMKQELKQIYDDVSAGKLSRNEALKRIRAIKLQKYGQDIGVLLAVPVWHETVIDRGIEANTPEWAEQHIILCELPKIDLAELQSLVGRS